MSRRTGGGDASRASRDRRIAPASARISGYLPSLLICSLSGNPSFERRLFASLSVSATLSMCCIPFSPNAHKFIPFKRPEVELPLNKTVVLSGIILCEMSK